MKLISLFIFFLISLTSFADLAIDRVKFNWLNKVEKSAHGAVHHTLFSKANNAEVGFYVYLPDHYENNPQAHYPVIYSLHGGGGDESKNLGRIHILKKAMELKLIPPSIMVFPNGAKSSAYLDSHDGSLKIKTMILKEIIPYVDDKFRTIPEARARAVHGFSMGGTGSCYLAFTHPEMFSSMTNFAGSGNMRVNFDPAAKDAHTKVRYFSNKKNMLGNDAQFWKENAGYYAIEKRQDYIRKKLGVRIVFGKKDKGIKGAEQLSAFLKSLNIPHDFVLHEGGHNWGTEQNGLDTMKFHSKHFMLSDQEKALLT
ncbi:putative esterase [Lentisphaera araneosa HTCC2155]|uniref:Putative esterase n=1 Tax=Lentisphaera araneosa HTCC2155 TaxID=313628 RepID=A6DF58_9BACT|nr:alpha/beta hydrolase-fold protein [Lentisphaera araneosa]EDM29438.1 putative esterase [Lentisphaera araneosa HTCC2155]